LPDTAQLSDLPVVTIDEFWAAWGKDGRDVLTGPQRDGIILATSGTGGSRKLCPHTAQEWRLKLESMAFALRSCGIQPGDRVANLYFGGALYSTMLSISGALNRCGAVEFPFGDRTPPQCLAKMLDPHEITVLAGTPTTLVRLAEALDSASRTAASVRLALFSGESVYADQQALFARVWPAARIAAAGYGSVDAGPLGYMDGTCGPDEYRPLASAIVEVLDDATDEPIVETGRPGKLVATRLDRALLPVLRYPVGDLAWWCGDGCFRILGRTDQGARVGLSDVFVRDVERVLEPWWKAAALTGLQIVTEHHDRRDRLILMLASAALPAHADAMGSSILEALFAKHPALKGRIESGEVLAPVVRWVAPDGLERNPVSGKTPRVIDRRGKS
jgi:phenylacetate-CoA ligase